MERIQKNIQGNIFATKQLQRTTKVIGKDHCLAFIDLEKVKRYDLKKNYNGRFKTMKNKQPNIN